MTKLRLSLLGYRIGSKADKTFQTNHRLSKEKLMQCFNTAREEGKLSQHVHGNGLDWIGS